jgi:hypothetical protein
MDLKVLLLTKGVSSNNTELKTNLLIPEAQLYATEKAFEETFRIIGLSIVITYNEMISICHILMLGHRPSLDLVWG